MESGQGGESLEGEGGEGMEGEGWSGEEGGGKEGETLVWSMDGGDIGVE